MDVKHLRQCLARTSPQIFKKLNIFLYVSLAFWWCPETRGQILVSTKAWRKFWSESVSTLGRAPHAPWRAVGVTLGYTLRGVSGSSGLSTPVPRVPVRPERAWEVFRTSPGGGWTCSAWVYAKGMLPAAEDMLLESEPQMMFLHL